LYRFDNLLARTPAMIAAVAEKARAAAQSIHAVVDPLLFIAEERNTPCRKKDATMTKM